MWRRKRLLWELVSFLVGCNEMFTGGGGWSQSGRSFGGFIIFEGKEEKYSLEEREV